MRKTIISVILLATAPAGAQMRVEGRVLSGRYPGSRDTVPLTGVVVFASIAGSRSEALSFRTRETEPAGWYHLSGAAGRYTFVFSTPAHFARPVVLTNIFLRNGDALDRRVEPRFDYAEFPESAWDTKPARSYFQPFTAAGTSVTSVGFKLATDGVDGPGPGSQDIIISIRRKGDGTPDAWERIGPEAHVLNVDCGGPKSYWYSCGWASGEVPTKPSENYAVEIRPAKPDGVVQAFWREATGGEPGCLRSAGSGAPAATGRRLWLTVASDGDGIVVSYPKRVHKQFHQLMGFASKWSQTYRARGRSLASVILYAAVGGAQPPLSRQRAVVRVRRGGPDGPTVGTEKIAIGNGNYTGDASWGTFGAAFSPAEVPLEPGEIYAIELESIETYATLHGFVNIKGQVSDDRPGFNPYRKCPPDDCEEGAAYRLGTERVDSDLDLQVLEYEQGATVWENAVDEKDFLSNGDMESGDLREADPASGRVDAWRPYSLEPASVHHYLVDPAAEGAVSKHGRIVRIALDASKGKKLDGGFVQRVEGLSHLETYRLSGLVRSTWPLDTEHLCLAGFDATGQTDDANAKTIEWTPMPLLHGELVPYSSDPIRPLSGSISVWLRASASKQDDRFPFRADFDDFALRLVRTGAPKAMSK